MEGEKSTDILGCLKWTFLKFPEPWDHFWLCSGPLLVALDTILDLLSNGEESYLCIYIFIALLGCAGH